MKRWLPVLATLVAAAPAIAETADQVARRYGLAGELLVARGDIVLLDRAYGTIAPDGGARHRIGTRWRLASITKQVTAVRIVGAAGERLDQPIGAQPSVPGASAVAAITPRQLLQHHSGLPNPDTMPAAADGVPAFYRARAPDLSYCLSAPAKVGPFSYNNCDYIVAAAVTTLEGGWPAGMEMARPHETGVAGYIAGKPEPHYELASFGAAGGLIGTADAVFRFDRALMTGKLLAPPARAELWKPEGGRSYQALGQWVFPGTLKGCKVQKRIVQRDGEIGGVQTRNYILPDDNLAIVVFTNRSSDDFPIGEIWQGKGFAFDLLSAVACETGA